MVYSSINRAIKALQISHNSLLDYIFNNYIYKSKFILSFEPIDKEKFNKYTIKPTGDNQLRKHITVYNIDNEAVAEFKSGREIARYWKIDGKVARAAIIKGEYLDFFLIVKEVSNRKIIYVFDSETKKLIDTLISVSKALKYAKVNFYTINNLIKKGISYQGKIYSYKDQL